MAPHAAGDASADDCATDDGRHDDLRRRTALDDDIVVALGFNYDPKADPRVHALSLEAITRTGKEPGDL